MLAGRLSGPLSDLLATKKDHNPLTYACVETVEFTLAIFPPGYSEALGVDWQSGAWGPPIFRTPMFFICVGEQTHLEEITSAAVRRPHPGLCQTWQRHRSGGGEIDGIGSSPRALLCGGAAWQQPLLPPSGHCASIP